jgi:hypothetical protein
MTDSEIVGDAARFPAEAPRAPHEANRPTDQPTDRSDPPARRPTPEPARGPGRRRPSAAETVGVLGALAVGGCYLLAPLMGGDLSAQLARADFASAHPLTPVDLQWFGGFLPFAYSAWVPWLMGLLGVRVTGVLATAVATWLTARLMVRTHAPRPAWGAAAAAVTLGSNLVEGRVTFACGIACGLAALLAVTRPGRFRRVGAAALALLAGAASPVAALLLAVCAVAFVLRRRVVDAAAILVAILPAGAMSLLFADSGRALFSTNDALRAIAISVVIIALVPVRTVRIVTTLGAALVLLLYLVATPVGVSSARLTLLFAVPVVVGYARVRRWWVPVAVAVAVVAQPPITFGTLRQAGSDATRAAYYQPLLDRIAASGLVAGRVEIPELTGHWEAYFVARRTPIARGWLRQTDIGLNNEYFYRHPPNVQSYQAFLRRTATQYVAVADAPATFYGRREIRLIDAGLPYLRPVWRSAHWRLYAVADATSIANAPGVLVAQNAAQITVEAPPNSDVLLRIRWWRWLILDGDSGACIAPAEDGVMLRVGSRGGGPARYVVSSGLVGAAGRGHC